jgi:hypothetical protein
MNSLVINSALANLIHLPHSTETKGIQLTVGQLVHATVQRVTEEGALLNFNGTTVQVKTDLALQPQQRVLLQVAQSSGNQVALQVVDAGNQAASAAGQLPTTSTMPLGNLGQLLVSWGLEADSTNQDIAKALFAHTQTLNPGTIQDVRVLWQQFSALSTQPSTAGNQAGALDTLIYLHTNRLPVTPESVALARHWLGNALPVAQRLSTLQSTLQQLQPQLQSALQNAQSAATLSQSANPADATTAPLSQPAQAANNTQLLTQLLDTVKATLPQLANLSITANTPSEQIVPRLVSLMTQLGTPPESTLLQQAASPTGTAAQAGPTTGTAGQPTMPAGGGAAAQAGATIVTDTAQTAGSTQTAGTAPQVTQGATQQPNAPVQASGTPGQQQAAAPATTGQAQTTTAGEQVPGSNADAPRGPGTHPPQPEIAATGPARGLAPDTLNPLQRLITAVRETVSQTSLDQHTTQLLHTLSNQLETIQRDLGAIQLANMSNAPQPAMEPYYMFPIPLQTPEGPVTAQLRVFRRNSQNQPLDPDNLRLALLLELPGLGDIAVKLSVFKQHLSGQIFSGRHDTERLVATELEELHNRLTGLGYHVDSLTSDILTTNQQSTEPELANKNEAGHIEVPLSQLDVTI